MAETIAAWRSTVGCKVLVAATGTVLWLWLVLHLLGNLTAFAGQGAMDAYAAALAGTGPLLWLVRGVLLAAFAVHVAGTIALARRARGARPVGYAVVRRRASTPAARSMRWGGALLFASVVFHVLHMAIGTLHPSFVPGQVYANLVQGLRAPLVACVYASAAVLVGMHLYHGLWAAPRSLGLERGRARALRRPVIAALALAMIAGFAAVPLAVALGVVR